MTTDTVWRVLFSACVTCSLCIMCLCGSPEPCQAASLQIATFDVDATPPLGSPVAYALVKSVADPLHAKGIVLLPEGQQPIVICVFDWIDIANGGQDWWRQELAVSAGTTPDRVAVHTVHQHDGPRCDMSTMGLFVDPQQAAPHFDIDFLRGVLASVREAIGQGIKKARPVTHVGIGKALVEKVASNRRILGPDGKVTKMRFSSCRDAELIAAPEGVIDPCLRLISFWNDGQPLVCLAYYATHPMSHYGKGDVSADFVGLARAERERASGVMHLYFTGAGGNVAAGKYNDGSPENRHVLAERMADAMRRAWDETSQVPVTGQDIQWRVAPIALPVAAHLDGEKLCATLRAVETTDKDRLAAASDLAWLERCEAGKKIDLTCLRVGPVYLVHMPGELFVEYQLAAANMRPGETVCMAAYGDYGPGYIGTTIAYSQGGYETSPQASLVTPDVEPVLMSALKRLLE